MNDHYFETRFVDANGTEIAPRRYRNLPEATADVVGLPQGSHGSIWYQDEPGSPSVEVLRQDADGSMVDVQNQDGTNYPVGGVTEYIDPGPIMFSLWLEDPQGRRAAYDFGFYWDGHNSAEWQCEPGLGGKSCSGTMRWSRQHVYWVDYDQEPEPDQLGDDLQVTYASSGDPSRSGEALINDAAVTGPLHRDSWVEVAEELFDFLRGNSLI